jgi:hypothetical protein
LTLLADFMDIFNLLKLPSQRYFPATRRQERTREKGVPGSQNTHLVQRYPVPVPNQIYLCTFVFVKNNTGCRADAFGLGWHSARCFLLLLLEARVVELTD